MTDSKHALLKAAVSGDEEALVALLRRYGPRVRKKLLGKIDVKWSSVLSEDDVMQETYADAFRSISQFELRGDGSFLRWLSTLASNNLRDAVESLGREKRGGGKLRVASQVEQDSHMQLFSHIQASITSPSGRAARNEVKELLNRAIEQLPESYRKVVTLYDLKERSAEEVAAVCECSPGAVYMRRARAHERLKTLLGPQSAY